MRKTFVQRKKNKFQGWVEARRAKLRANEAFLDWWIELVNSDPAVMDLQQEAQRILDRYNKLEELYVKFGERVFPKQKGVRAAVEATPVLSD